MENNDSSMNLCVNINISLLHYLPVSGQGLHQIPRMYGIGTCMHIYIYTYIYNYLPIYLFIYRQNSNIDVSGKIQRTMGIAGVQSGLSRVYLEDHPS